MGWLVDSSSSEEETGSLSSSSSFVPTMLELLTFGSLIAATDPVSVLAIFEEKAVDPHLFYIVFGESALNDAVAIVLFRTFADVLVSTAATTEFDDGDTSDDDNVIFSKVLAILWHFMLKAVGSPIVGMLFGFCAALIFKHVDFREFEMLELSLCMLCMYIPYILAYSLNLSGIVAIFFSGMSSRRYIMPNLSKDTQATCKSIFKLASYLSEISIFLELGLSVIGFSGDLNWPFILWAFLACLLGRAMALYPLIFIYNWSLTELLTIPPPPASDASTADVTESTRKASDEYDFAPLLGDLATLSQKGGLENLPPISDDKVNKSKRSDNNNMFSLSYGSLSTKSKGHKKKDSGGCSGNELASSSQASLKQARPTNKNKNNKKCPPKKRHRRIRSIRMMPQQSMDKKITWNMAHILWFAGVRGAVAYACVREFPNIYGHSDDFIGATMIIVLVTIIVHGGATEHFATLVQYRNGCQRKGIHGCLA